MPPEMIVMLLEAAAGSVNLTLYRRINDNKAVPEPLKAQGRVRLREIEIEERKKEE